MLAGSSPAILLSAMVVIGFSPLRELLCIVVGGVGSLRRPQQRRSNKGIRNYMLTRFNKGYPVELAYPLREIPAAVVEIDGVKHDSMLASPRIGKKHGLPTPIHFEEEGFAEQLQEVIEVRRLVESGVYPAEFLARHHPEPDRFDPYTMPPPLMNEGLSVYNPQGCANVVHMDNPLDMPNAVLRWLNSINTPLKAETGHIDFLEAVPAVVAATAKAIDRNLSKAFEAKYYFGLIRPEEALHNVYSGQSMTIDCRSLTAYPEGCPFHPSYPAGHGAAAAGVKALEDHFYLTNEVQDVVFDTAYLWSQFRTLAGVHYADDNLAGLAIGGLLTWDKDNERWIRAW